MHNVYLEKQSRLSKTMFKKILMKTYRLGKIYNECNYIFCLYTSGCYPLKNAYKIFQIFIFTPFLSLESFLSASSATSRLDPLFSISSVLLTLKMLTVPATEQPYPLLVDSCWLVPLTCNLLQTIFFSAQANF